MAEYGILIMPMHICFGEDTYNDQEEISTAQFYERLVSGREFPTTSYPAIGRFQQAVDAELAAGNQVLVITIARPLSGCYDAVKVLLADYPLDQVAVFDSQSATLGEGAIVLAAARLIADGCSWPELLAKMPQLIARSRGFGAINNLTYLAKGGRISGAAATVATALRIKPVINICPDGSLEVAQKLHGMAKAINWLTERLQQDGHPLCQLYHSGGKRGQAVGAVAGANAAGRSYLLTNRPHRGHAFGARLRGSVLSNAAGGRITPNRPANNKLYKKKIHRIG